MLGLELGLGLAWPCACISRYVSGYHRDINSICIPRRIYAYILSLAGYLGTR